MLIRPQMAGVYIVGTLPPPVIKEGGGYDPPKIESLGGIQNSARNGGLN